MLWVRLEMLSYMAARVQSDLQRAATNGTLAAALERAGVKVAGTPAAATNTTTDAAGEDAATSGSATVNDSWSPAAIAGTVAGAVAIAGAASAMLIMVSEPFCPSPRCSPQLQLSLFPNCLCRNGPASTCLPAAQAMVRRRVAGAAPPHNPAGAAPNAPAKSSAPTASTTALADVGKGLHKPNTVFLVASCVPAQSAAAGGGGGSPTRRAGGGGSLDAYV